MPTGEQNTNPAKRDHVLDLISAVAAGDAARGDIVSALREEGIDSLDVLIEVLAEATRSGRGRRSRSRFLNSQQLSNRTAPGRASKAARQVPKVPFLLRGILYDPADIERFNGQKLHFLSARSRDQLLVIDDRAVMESWWQLSYVSSNLESIPHTLAPNEMSPYKVVPTDVGGPVVIVPPPEGSSGPEGFGPPVPAPPPPHRHTNFYEDIYYGGSRLELAPNRGYEDLTEVSYTFFGTGDWNDTISSIEMVRTNVAVLYEHVGYAGRTFTATHNEPDLTLWGWNDVASSVATW